MEEERFLDRIDGGQRLARQLSRWKRDPDGLVLALPRGGVPVGYAVAEALELPLDVFVVRKLGVPGHEELAMGAIASGGVRILNREIVDELRISDSEIAAVAANEEREMRRREWIYREGRPAESARGKTVILVDDGLATGATMRAAIQAVRRQAPARVIVAVPVAAADTCQALREEADEVVCLLTPRYFRAVGLWYEEFGQTSDGEVQEYLEKAADRLGAA